MSKSMFKSKTLWINGLVLVTAWLLNHKGVMQAAGLDADTQVMILGVVNFVNRFFTSDSVHVA